MADLELQNKNIKKIEEEMIETIKKMEEEMIETIKKVEAIGKSVGSAVKTVGLAIVIVSSILWLWGRVQFWSENGGWFLDCNEIVYLVCVIWYGLRVMVME